MPLIRTNKGYSCFDFLGLRGYFILVSINVAHFWWGIGMKIPRSYIREMEKMYNVGKGLEISQVHFSEGKLSENEYLIRLKNLKIELASIAPKYSEFKKWKRELKLKIRGELEKLLKK